MRRRRRRMEIWKEHNNPTCTDLLFGQAALLVVVAMFPSHALRG
jgi:hypothetical protein